MDHYIILNWVENSGSYTKSHGMPPRPLWVCPQEQWPVDCTQVCMHIAASVTEHLFFCWQAACCQKKSTEAPVLETVLQGPCVKSGFPHKLQKFKEFSSIKFWWMNFWRTPKTTHNNRWSSLTLLCTGNLNSIAKGSRSSRCLQQRRQSWHFRQWSRRLLSQCSQVLTSFWNDPTYPNVTQLSTPTASCNSATRSSEDFAC